ncbi:hypothetical protein TNIN_270121 [Trichonephila inaurata madagascariensis]|uniref:Uncharacterized protein n=1 Tax=Trichonephila inaurata madagascariensis TaxID=2747483 RepID=A0A8X6YDD7_9ARAC|nr:hypothetical protein TNIN_270121 [Trichonephila inaurata madagascariensis]
MPAPASQPKRKRKDRQPASSPRKDALRRRHARAFRSQTTPPLPISGTLGLLYGGKGNRQPREGSEEKNDNKTGRGGKQQPTAPAAGWRAAPGSVRKTTALLS